MGLNGLGDTATAGVYATSGGYCFPRATASLRTKILDFRGFDSNIFLISRGGIPRPIGNFPESLSQRILVLRFLVLYGDWLYNPRCTSCGASHDSPRPPDALRLVRFSTALRSSKPSPSERHASLEALKNPSEPCSCRMATALEYLVSRDWRAACFERKRRIWVQLKNHWRGLRLRVWVCAWSGKPAMASRGRHRLPCRTQLGRVAAVPEPP